MKAINLVFVLLFLSIPELKCQPWKVNQEGQELFLKGSQLIEMGNYKSADSILTLALCSYKNENVYYNRGISRLYLTDTIGFCEDMSIAANKYFDIPAGEMFNKSCCQRVDTIYYDKSFIISDSSNYKYLEEFKYLKQTNELVGVIHERNANIPKSAIDFGCERDLIGVSFKTTDIIAVYSLLDSIKYFYITSKPPVISNQFKYEELKNKAQSYLSSKYKDLKKVVNKDKISVYFEIYVQRTGDVINAKYLGFFPEIMIGEKEKELQKDILDIAKNYPKLTPALFNKTKVDFIAYDFIEF